MKNYDYVAVINANAGSISDVLGISQGVFTVDGDTGNNVTNLGTVAELPWSGIKSKTKTVYAAGVYRQIRLSFNPMTTPVDGHVYTLTLSEIKTDKRLSATPPVTLSVSVIGYSGMTKLQLATAFYNKLIPYNKTGAFVTTHVPSGGSEYVLIQGQFGDTDSGVVAEQIEINNFSVVFADDTNAAVTKADEVALVQPKGTTLIVDYYTDSTSYSVGSKQYTLFEVVYDIPVKQDVIKGNAAYAEKTLAVFVNEDVLAVFTAEYNAIMAGLKKITKDISVFTEHASTTAITTSTNHGLATGDTVRFEGVVGAAWSAGYLGLNNQIYSITYVDPDQLTIALNSSGFASSFASGRLVISDPYLAR